MSAIANAVEPIQTEPVVRLRKDLLSATITLSPSEARFLVDSYYTMQDNRIRTAGQIRALNASGEPHSVIDWYFTQSETLENQIKRALDAYAQSKAVGRWLLSIHGIGPVISAGLLAHIDITKAPTVGHIWNFAGLNPDVKWNKGEKRPFNAGLKVLCWKAGQSFMKFAASEKCFYGKLYRERKAQEVERNEALQFKDQAEKILEVKKIGKATDAYKAYSVGKLPPAQIDARARRWAVKLFLSHLHEKMYVDHYGQMPPKPFAIEHLGHAHYIAPPE
jgi:hypothetical protein